MNKKENIIIYGKQKGFSIQKINSMVKYYKILESSNYGKSISNLTKQEVLKETKKNIASKGAAKTFINILNEVLKFGESEVKIYESDVVDWIDKDEKEKFYYKDELIEICKGLNNVQDRFILYGLFLGISENSIVNLKIGDVDLVNCTIKLYEGDIHIDNFMKSILDDVLDKKDIIYYTHIKESKHSKNSRKFYKLNEKCEYIIKCKPSKKNNNGLECMKQPGLKDRLKNISNSIGYRLRSNDIFRSGAIHKMSLHKLEWERNEVNIFQKENNIKGNAYDLLRIFNLKYGYEYKKVKLLKQREVNIVTRKIEITDYYRDENIKKYTKNRANGICELCKKEAPFLNKENEPYLEVHHIKWLADGGSDSVDNTVALCPNCHRKMHILNRQEDIDALNNIRKY